MTIYTVEWTCEVDANSPEEAVRSALAVMGEELSSGNPRALDTYRDHADDEGLTCWQRVNLRALDNARIAVGHACDEGTPNG